jgi:hypothetical protein
MRRLLFGVLLLVLSIAVFMSEVFRCSCGKEYPDPTSRALSTHMRTCTAWKASSRLAAKEGRKARKAARRAVKAEAAETETLEEIVEYNEGNDTPEFSVRHMLSL